MSIKWTNTWSSAELNKSLQWPQHSSIVPIVVFRRLSRSEWPRAVVDSVGAIITQGAPAQSPRTQRKRGKLEARDAPSCALTFVQFVSPCRESKSYQHKEMKKPAVAPRDDRLRLIQRPFKPDVSDRSVPADAECEATVPASIAESKTRSIVRRGGAIIATVVRRVHRSRVYNGRRSIVDGRGIVRRRIIC